MNLVIVLRLLTIIFFIQTTSFAQKKIDGYFVIPKLGLFDSRESEGIAFFGEGGILKNNTIVGISYSRMPEFLGADFSNSVDATIGKFKMENSSVFFHAQAGFGILWGEVWRTSEEDLVPFLKACTT